MTKRSLSLNFIVTIVLLIGVYGAGWFISLHDDSTNRFVFTTYKDLLPIVLGMAAAWLAFCTQRRSAYQQQLRSVWTKLIEAVQYATQYTHLASPTQAEFSSALVKVSVAIDEIRGVFRNLGESESKIGLYPYEPIKDIYVLLTSLGYGPAFQSASAEATREKMFALWKDARIELLKEFDREEPTFPHSHWKDAKKKHVYTKHNIPPTKA
jgi:hypothetical protein